MQLPAGCIVKHEQSRISPFACECKVFVLQPLSPTALQALKILLTNGKVYPIPEMMGHTLDLPQVLTLHLAASALVLRMLFW